MACDYGADVLCGAQEFQRDEEIKKDKERRRHGTEAGEIKKKELDTRAARLQERTCERKCKRVRSVLGKAN